MYNPERAVVGVTPASRTGTPSVARAGEKAGR